MLMDIVVCLKQVLDPELPPKEFKLDASGRKPVLGSAKLVLDSYAENALEVALQIKEKQPGSRVTALSVSDKSADDGLRRALAMGADQAIRVWADDWSELDALGVAHVLGRTVRKLGAALVLTGRQSSDIERGLVGPLLAEELGAVCVTLATHVELDGERLRVLQEIPAGTARLESRVPAVVTVTSHEHNVPRMPKVKDLMMAARKPIDLLSPDSLDLDQSRMAPGAELLDLFIPTADGSCEMIEGDGGPGRARALAQRLRTLNVL